MVEEYKIKIPTIEEQKVFFGNEGLKRYFFKIKKILNEFMDLQREEDYTLVSVWIIGTYLHKQFSTYPYLYFNAMKGSGKTRILKIISSLSKNGKLAGSMTEAVLFRKAKERTLCIDELESSAKGKENLQLLLNSAYKKGLSVERMTKQKTLGKEEQVVEEFEVYCPIALANIWGMDNTLSDRCISLILEKSNKAQITKLIETFDNDIEFEIIKGGLKRLTEKLGGINLFGNIFIKWNEYQKNIVKKVSNVNKVNNVNIVIDKLKNNIKTDNIDNTDAFTLLFEKINNVNLSGRDLELFFPLYIISDICGCLNEILKISEVIVKERKESDREENRDVRLIEFLAQTNYESFIDVSLIVKDFQEFLGEEEKWINSRGVSRALKRLNLILDRRSTGKKRQIKVDILKAQEKILMFKEPEINFSVLKIKEELEDE